MQSHGGTCEFSFTLLCVCVLHSLYVCLVRHSALHHIPRFECGPPFSVEDPVFTLSTIYCLPPSPRSRLFPFFLSIKLGPTAVSLLPKTIFMHVCLLFSTWLFFSII